MVYINYLKNIELILEYIFVLLYHRNILIYLFANICENYIKTSTTKGGVLF